MPIRPVTWILQTGFRGDHNTEILKKALDDEQFPWVEITLPFEGPIEIPLDPKQVTPIFYGSTVLRDRILRDPLWSHGVYFDPSRFEFEACRKGFGKFFMLNGDARVMTVLDFMASVFPSNRHEQVFIRPTGDTKTIVGGVQTRGEWVDTLSLNMNNVLGPLPSTTIVVGTPKTLVRECRVFIVNREAEAASTYRFAGESNTAIAVPPNVWDFAHARARDYDPAIAYTMDICELPDGSLKIVEVNCVNCSGLYRSDARSLVMTMTAQAQKKERILWDFSIEKWAGPCPHDGIPRCSCVCHTGMPILHDSACCHKCYDCGAHLLRS